MSSQIKVAVRKQSFLTAYNTFTPRWLAPEHAGRHGMQHPATRQAERTQATKARRGHERAHAISQSCWLGGVKKTPVDQAAPHALSGAAYSARILPLAAERNPGQ